MDDAHLFQCAGGDLPGVHGGGGASTVGPAGVGALHRAAVLCARRHRHPHLHRGLSFLRRQGVAGVSENRAPHMTRRGTLAYYLAAWVIGCFVAAFLQWTGEALAGEIHTASILLTTYFFTLVFGAATILLFAFVLRRGMRMMRTHALWAWLLSGAILSVL